MLRLIYAKHANMAIGHVDFVDAAGILYHSPVRGQGLIQKLE
jgi:hypothetical protein